MMIIAVAMGIMMVAMIAVALFIVVATPMLVKSIFSQESADDFGQKLKRGHLFDDGEWELDEKPKRW
ncbi:MAG: hypothetical protein K8I82_24155 [Anaerolineae bacterium]|nr:hypothetical protein [Anaerolineae bacterium]